MPKAARTRAQQRRLEWALLALALLCLVAWLSPPQQMAGLNHLVQDLGLRSLARPPHPDIVVIAVDDRSITSIGRWPWRRALHAQLVDVVTAQNPKAIGLDILFSEPDLDYPLDDALLAQALARSQRVVLPVLQRNQAGLMEGASELPLDVFADAAAALGHVHVAPDGDGVVRGLYLQEGPASAPWSHFSLALQCVAQNAAARCKNSPPTNSTPVTPPHWTERQPELIAYAGGPGHYPTYSYIDVLRGRVPPNAFQGKYVLVGAVASGLGDTFATPVSSGARLMPGVEVVAHILDSHLSGIRLKAAPAAANIAFNLLPVAVALLTLLFAGPLTALLASFGLGLGTLLMSMALMRWTGWHFAPAAALLGLVLAYPLWSWRRLSAAAHFLRTEMEHLRSEGLPVRNSPWARRGDFLERRINAVEAASRQLRDLHQFVSNSLQQLPAPNFVCDAQGRILLANVAAQRHVGLGPFEPQSALQGKSIFQVLHDLQDAHTLQPLLSPDKLLAGQIPAQSEGHDAKGRSLLMLCKPFTEFANVGWLITLVDMTEIRRALQQRDQALHFISHDIRAPNASILTLLEMQRNSMEPLQADELLKRIEKYAQASLSMAESFVRLASAQSNEYRVAPLDLASVLQDAVDDAWTQASNQEVSVTILQIPHSAPCVGDRPLLARAMANVLNNAIKYSPARGTVRCSLYARGPNWVISIRDEGPGIDPAQQDRLFKPFSRLHDQTHPNISGVGLGLALVHTVVKRHGGSLELESAVGQGAEFRLVLPASASD